MHSSFLSDCMTLALRLPYWFSSRAPKMRLVPQAATPTLNRNFLYCVLNVESIAYLVLVEVSSDIDDATVVPETLYMVCASRAGGFEYLWLALVVPRYIPSFTANSQQGLWPAATIHRTKRIDDINTE